jgi:hypothetical protein
MSAVSLNEHRSSGTQKGPEMVPKATENKAAERRRLTEQMLDLGQTIDRQQSGPERLEMLRLQATLSDKREALSSKRH